MKDFGGGGGERREDGVGGREGWGRWRGGERKGKGGPWGALLRFTPRRRGEVKGRTSGVLGLSQLLFPSGELRGFPPHLLLQLA